MKDRSRDKDAVNESPSSTRDSDLIHASRKHQQDFWGLEYSDFIKPCGKHAGLGCSRLQGSLGREGGVPSGLEVTYQYFVRVRHSSAI